ncbi:hypothetical protein JM946_23635 [Steroidobacter sp. S1-65]|uniref:EF-hand domain-containing protein n=1 Tax=Steroidobacter gossypii TaxID=2805490 RepID=A0ABS1X3E1_9GAMM|nr:hypothetical protein [Steroidobacter gossypii]MBM0107748.1 hypothetical protein [Steroidobacter gossypii]
MDKFVFAAIAGTATLLASAGAFGDDPGKGRIAAADSFNDLDRNGDHRISRSEAGFDRLFSQTFAEVDADGDGFVSAAEFAAAEKTRTNLTAR